MKRTRLRIDVICKTQYVIIAERIKSTCKEIYQTGQLRLIIVNPPFVKIAVFLEIKIISYLFF
jgi:hypothetical protein